MLDETKLFDFVKIMFTKKDLYTNIKQHSKKRHHFMVNRFFSIKYPSNAQMFNVNGIDGASVVDCWSLVADRFKSVPGWIYTKTKKTKAEPKDKYNPSQEAIDLFLEKNEIGMREFNELKEFYKKDLYSDLQKIEKQINVYD
jgi:translation initiation factor 2 gamma subunit (eIF-2gamma)